MRAGLDLLADRPKPSPHSSAPSHASIAANRAAFAPWPDWTSAASANAAVSTVRTIHLVSALMPPVRSTTRRSLIILKRNYPAPAVDLELPLSRVDNIAANGPDVALLDRMDWNCLGMRLGVGRESVLGIAKLCSYPAEIGCTDLGVLRYGGREGAVVGHPGRQQPASCQRCGRSLLDRALAVRQRDRARPSAAVESGQGAPVKERPCAPRQILDVKFEAALIGSHPYAGGLVAVEHGEQACGRMLCWRQLRRDHLVVVHPWKPADLLLAGAGFPRCSRH